MSKFFIKWQINQINFPAADEERAKLAFSVAEMMKADINSGKFTEWQIFVSGNEGYAVSELNEVDLLAHLLKYDTYFLFQVSPVLSLDQMVESMTKTAAMQSK
jgi:hypothetical protein